MQPTRFDAALPHGITLSCRAAGRPDAPQRVLMLHGFPEAAFVWDEVAQGLADADAVYAVAPNLRGYEHSSAPAGVEAYRAKHLVADVEALIQQLGAPVDVLVAHDWGGGIAWNLAALKPHLLRQLVIVNSPHPAAFLRELCRSAEQQQASDYMLELVKPDAAPRLAKDDFAYLFDRLERFSPAPWLTATQRAQYREVWSCGLDPALNYYRASPLRPPVGPDDPVHALQLPDSVVRVSVPTRILWGEQDHALRPALLDGLSAWVPNLVGIERVPEASHWIVHEQPVRVVQTIRAALQAARA